MGSTLNLFRLQQIDNQINQVQTRIQNGRHVLDDNSVVQLASSKYSDFEIHFNEAEKALKKAENELQELQIKIQQNESSMYGKSNHTPKELIDLQNEITSQKKFKNTLEEKIIELMGNFETAELNKNMASSEKEIAQNDWNGTVAHIQDDLRSLGNDLHRLSEERNAAIGGIPPKELEIYEKLRLEKRGVAVAIVEEKCCSACGSTLSPGQIQATRTPNSIFPCPSCGRILYGG